MRWSQLTCRSREKLKPCDQYSILEKEPPPLSDYFPKPPAELQRIISKALSKNREERYQAVKDLLI